MSAPTTPKRAGLTPEQRSEKVVGAITDLAESIDAAVSSLRTNGPEHPVTLACWERVEKAGATVHRQSRLLAGKSKGG
jgi:hypothetical protein